MRFALLAILALYAATAAAQPEPRSKGEGALQAIDACIAKLDAALDIGYERVAARCPRLTRSLEQSEWAEWLPRGWTEARNDLSAGSLAELRMLVARELEAPVSRPGPRVDRLNEVLAALGSAARERSSLWTRFRSWLRTVVERNKQTRDSNWLDDMIRRNGRSQTFIDLLTYTVLGLLLALAGFIIVNEMRAAGLLRLRSRPPGGKVMHDPERQKPLSWHDVELAAASEKPRLLLELVIEKLTQLRRLPPAGALTVRELTRTVELPAASARERLSALALIAERARYSTAAVAPEAVETAVKQARELLAHLDESA